MKELKEQFHRWLYEMMDSADADEKPLAEEVYRKAADRLEKDHYGIGELLKVAIYQMATTSGEVYEANMQIAIYLSNIVTRLGL